MNQLKYILSLFILGCSMVFCQVREHAVKVEIEGSVKGMENHKPIRGVEVTTNSGMYAVTNDIGGFKINASIGDELVFTSPEFETVRHIIKSDEDVDVLVEGYSETNLDGSKNSDSRNSVSMHRTYLDSANFYKRSDIAKSIDFITRSIEELGERADKKQLAISLTVLGEVYQYHRQFDLAITSYKDALEANKTSRTTLLLGRTYILNNNFEEAERILLPLVDITDMIPYQRIELFEILGDAYAGMDQIDMAVTFYEQGLTVAKKNQITPKMTDLNSKIGDAYAKGDRLIEAEAYYGNSLKLSSSLAPERAVQEKEKVADFYNQRSQYVEEIEMRKKIGDELKRMPKTESEVSKGLANFDTITSQRNNYKIANAYIVQDQYDQAIPYLKQSIEEADVENDLVVQKDATRKLSEVYKYRGEYSKALETLQEYAALVDTLYVRKEQEISRAARFNREIAAKQSRISGLEQERELSQSKYSLALTEQELVERSNRMQQWIIYSLILGLVLTGLAAFFFYRSNQQQKLANNLLALKSLRSQMNPHFIFNALNSVNNFIAKSDERSANRYLSEFSTLMRAVLENSEEDFIPLAKELELLKLYTKLEHSRFSDKFDYEINLDKRIDVEAYWIPPMLLQPYIENAIWHGLRYKNEKGYLRIALNQKGPDTVEIEIVDNGIGRKRSAELKTSNQKRQKSKGMGNIKRRIAILNDMYKDKVDVSISDLETDGAGTKVVFTLKKD
ncbi:histidine kinase [Maribacter algicola]|uniref:Histidine kinase n=1 Tax=Meishania litoralis TaxID=3434685 RepID=A0ACC7LGR3_9FLAO